jgi:hypothetical protein
MLRYDGAMKDEKEVYRHIFKIKRVSVTDRGGP